MSKTKKATDKSDEYRQGYAEAIIYMTKFLGEMIARHPAAMKRIEEATDKLKEAKDERE